MSVSPTIPKAAWISFVALIAASGSLAAESITLRPVADTSLFVLNGGSNNFGANTTLVVGTTASGSTSRAVLRFDIAGNLPAQAIITSVQLNLVVTKANSAGVGSTFALHRLLQSWGEGNKTGNTGAPATAGEATWFHRFFPATVWGAPGAAAPVDFSADAGASANVDLPDTYTFGSSSNLVEDVQTWLGDPAANFGWIVLSQSEGTASPRAKTPPTRRRWRLILFRRRGLPARVFRTPTSRFISPWRPVTITRSSMPTRSLQRTGLC